MRISDWSSDVCSSDLFGTLVENGYVKPGAVLFDAKRRWKATVRVDGSLEAEGDTGSIHKLGATLQNAPSCNGWTFWHYEDGEKLKPIDRKSTRLNSSH